ncbi:MAG: ShlB/FhaC/HecB family hemolysin secretion/activation protein [Candidatus Omnitrophica bacterium]|nr:ShlB/FhaC/HecB family hemolysin secretion/activation protein [Candidatus Omnitrophota bacterium]
MRVTRVALISTLTYLFSLLFISVPSAFSATPAPGNDAGVQGERFRSESEQRKAEFTAKKREAPKIESEGEGVPPVTPGIRFVLKGVTIDGNTLLNPSEIVSAYLIYMDRWVTDKEVYDIAKKIDIIYKSKGYITSNVYVPEQDIKDGNIVIGVVEGKVGDITVEGNKWFSKEYFTKKFRPLKKNKVFNAKEFQEILLRFNKNSDLDVKTVIKKGAKEGTSDVVLKVNDKFPWHVGGGFDDQGTRLVGKYRELITARSSNCFGFGDSFYTSTLFSKGSTGENLSYSSPVDDYGTNVGIDFTLFDTTLGEEFKPLHVKSRFQSYTPYISWQLYLSEVMEMRMDTGFDVKSTVKRNLGTVTTNEELRLPYLSFDMNFIDSFGGYTDIKPKVSCGTQDFLGASAKGNDLASRLGTDRDFLKYEHAVSRYQRMPLDSYMTIAHHLQTSNYSLPSSEQFQLGGMNSVRGYPEGDYMCDIGANLNMDWYFPFYPAPKGWNIPFTKQSIRDAINPFVFFDAGTGKLVDTLPGELKSKFLMGYGSGLRFKLYNNVSCKMLWAAPAGERPAHGDGPSTFYFTVNAES